MGPGVIHPQVSPTWPLRSSIKHASHDDVFKLEWFTIKMREKKEESSVFLRAHRKENLDPEVYTHFE